MKLFTDIVSANVYDDVFNGAFSWNDVFARRSGSTVYDSPAATNRPSFLTEDSGTYSVFPFAKGDGETSYLIHDRTHQRVYMYNLVDDLSLNFLAVEASNIKDGQFAVSQNGKWEITDLVSRMEAVGLDVPVFSKFTNSVLLDGGAVEIDTLKDAYSKFNEYAKNNASILIMPGACKSGVIYGMDNKTGATVPLRFARATTATLFDKNKDIKLSAVDFPRIDYANYTQEAKILIEKSGTNLISYSSDALSWSPTGRPTIIKSDKLAYGFENYNEFTPTGAGNGFYINNSPVVQAETGFFKICVHKGTIDTINIIFISVLTGKAVSVKSYTTLLGELQGTNTLVSDEAYIQRELTNMTIGDTIRFRATFPNIIGNSFMYASAQYEDGQSTSYIPTNGAQATRSADLLECPVANYCSVYLKTTKQTVVMDKPVGTWNIHEDLDNEGILELAVFDRILTEEEKNQLYSQQ